MDSAGRIISSYLGLLLRIAVAGMPIWMGKNGDEMSGDRGEATKMVV